jgi:hypothetical protein
MTKPQTVNKHLLIGELYEKDKQEKLSEIASLSKWESGLVEKARQEQNKKNDKKLLEEYLKEENS